MSYLALVPHCNDRRIGTRTVGGAHGDRELAEHFRFLHIALAAWRVTGTALFYNGDEERQALEWHMAGAADWQRIELAPGEMREYPLETKGVRRGTP